MNQTPQYLDNYLHKMSFWQQNQDISHVYRQSNV